MSAHSNRSDRTVSVEPLEHRQLFAAASAYSVTALVSDGTVGGGAASGGTIDSTLKNPWGLVAGARGLELATNHAGYIQGYKSTGAAVGAHAILPSGVKGAGQGTGIVYNTTTSYVLPGTSTPATYIASTEDGNIVAWNPDTSVRTPTTVIDNHGTAEYEAVAIGTATVHGAAHRYLYATNFTDRSVDVFNSGFSASHVVGTFTDPSVPSNYSPFGIFVNGSTVYVSYCQLENTGDEDHDGAGLGMLSQFNTDGTFVRTMVAPGGPLNAPYGMAIAPKTFGTFRNDLLVGSFGDGTVTGIDPRTGAIDHQLKRSDGHTFSVDGPKSLWGLTFGNGNGGTDPAKLYYASGTNNEAGGSVGYIAVSGTAAIAKPAIVTASAFSTTSIASTHKQDPSTDLESIVS